MADAPRKGDNAPGVRRKKTESPAGQSAHDAACSIHFCLYCVKLLADTNSFKNHRRGVIHGRRRLQYDKTPLLLNLPVFICFLPNEQAEQEMLKTMRENWILHIDSFPLCRVVREEKESVRLLEASRICTDSRFTLCVFFQPIIVLPDGSDMKVCWSDTSRSSLRAIVNHLSISSSERRSFPVVVLLPNLATDLDPNIMVFQASFPHARIYAPVQPVGNIINQTLWVTNLTKALQPPCTRELSAEMLAFLEESMTIFSTSNNSSGSQNSSLSSENSMGSTMSN
eukprot:TRINITY_DN2507_c0_g1::TRINITY_DN2507_c0_g1_i2::g.19415::m.19415 TRINITY_DN2507_c0_g1::TRINITY_DN2507_c0_g1_i2::g.19415  ORF type:complete len:283 (-),score=10.29,zf-C2H2_jaz/PF12171.3/0.18,zf-U1/PF06220.7/0.37 TRINITY_DN2507_c0_g1_i2:262-1110(-)